jgi:hypothetical protein
MKINVQAALANLYPDGKFFTDWEITSSEQEGEWISKWLRAEPQPTTAELQSAESAGVAYLESIVYKKTRKRAHLPIQDQLDMQYWDAINSTTTWVDYVTTLKAQIPKG